MDSAHPNVANPASTIMPKGLFRVVVVKVEVKSVGVVVVVEDPHRRDVVARYLQTITILEFDNLPSIVVLYGDSNTQV